MFLFGRKKLEEKFVAVLPKNYRSIALYTIAQLKSPKVFMNKKEISDLTDQGNLTQKGIRNCRAFLICEGKEEVLGFGDHPNEMWITVKYRPIAEFCEKQKWLKIQHIIP